MSIFSDISMFAGDLESRAKVAAVQETKQLIRSGALDRNNEAKIREEFNTAYIRNYYALAYKERSLRDGLRENRFPRSHTGVRFSKSNLFIVCKGPGCPTVERFEYPLDEDKTLETKEAYILEWPGPLDRFGDSLKSNVSRYINNLSLQEHKRRLRYAENYEDQRNRIIRILKQLLSGNGNLDAETTTSLFLKEEQWKPHSGDKHQTILRKHLLVGQRKDAIRHAKLKQLWNHSTCLCLLDEFQPPVKCDLDKHDNIIEYLKELLDSITVEDEILDTVYRALLGKIPHRKTQPAKKPNVNSDDYKFAILCANDCEMEFDSIREDFKLVVESKKSYLDRSLCDAHLIQLGRMRDTTSDDDELSDQSLTSYYQDETRFSRTSIISNIDMLILNEVWEYCLNLARGTCNPESYDYIINLIPFKLLFASKLLDFGVGGMFQAYMESINRALHNARLQNFNGADPFYDWTKIQESVQYINDISRFCFGPNSLPPEYAPTYEESSSHPQPSSYSQPNQDHPDTTHDYSSLPHQSEVKHTWSHLPPPPPPITSTRSYSNNIPPPYQYQAPIPEETPSDFSSYQYQASNHNQPVNDFNPEPYPEPIPEETTNDFSPDPLPDQADQQQQQDYDHYNESNEPSRRQSLDAPLFSPPSRSQPGSVPKTMTSSPLSQPAQSPQSNSPGGDPQQQSFLRIFSNLLPKGPKEMKLPDDSHKPIQYNHEQQEWVDTTQQDNEKREGKLEPPPVAPPQPPAMYSAPKSTRARYPKPTFQMNE